MPKVQRKVFDGINMTQGRWDQSRNFKIFDHVFTGSNYDKLSREFNVTLATQSSLDKIYWWVFPLGAIFCWFLDVITSPSTCG